MAEIKIRNAHKIYSNGFHAVKGIDLDIKDKEFVVLVGPSGCGKTTLLRMIAGLEDISDGEIFINDRVINNVPVKDRDLVMVFQSYALYAHMNVFDNMAFSLKLRKRPRKEIEEKVMETAKMLGIEQLLQNKPKQLSGGQRQRVALGRAIVRKPVVFLMDEPLSNLDAKLRVQTRAQLIKLHQQLATTFVYVTHDQVEAMTMGNRIVVMCDGIIQQVADAKTIYTKPTNLFVAGFIGSPPMNFIEALVEEDNGKLYFNFNSYKLLVPEAQVAAIRENGKREVILGIRSEDIKVGNSYPGYPMAAKCEVIERLGSEENLFLDMEGMAGKNIVAKVESDLGVEVGQTVKFLFEPSKLHVFDSESKETISR